VQSNVFERDGELQEISVDGRPKKRTNPVDFPYSHEEKKQFYLQLKRYALERAAQGKVYAPGWPKANYRDKFKAWPAWSWEMLPPADVVGAEVRNYIRSKFMAWAASNPRRQAS
jgi:hypothetical protein